MRNLLPSKERVISIGLILIAIGYGVFVTFKLLEDKTLMLVPKDKLENVQTCIDNTAACGLIQETWKGSK